jgi:membrane fusion protein (multidrug efflux system)
MKRAIRLLVYLLILAAIVAASGAGFAWMRARSKKTGAPTAALKAIPVRLAPVSRANLRNVLVLSGNIEPVLQVDLKSKISGRLERLALDSGARVEEGTPVKAGEIVAVLEHRDLDAQAAQAGAAVKTAEAGIKAAETARADTQRERRRAENLLAQGSTTEQARDRAATADDRAAAALEQAKAQLDQARAALQAAEVMQAEAVLRAPFDGIVSGKYADPGAMISPLSPLLRIVSTDEVRILVAVPTSHLPALVSGRASAEVSVDVWPGRVFPCAIRTVFPEVSESTRTATLELRVKNPKTGSVDMPLRPGMYASIRIVLDTRENVIAVPVDAIIRVRDRSLVFLAEGPAARARDITIGLRDGAQAEILSGLTNGESLVVSGQQRLTDGAAVTPVSDVPEAGSAAENRP